MRLHEADAYLERARLCLARGERSRAGEAYEKARGMVEEMGYGRRDAEVAELAAALGEER